MKRIATILSSIVLSVGLLVGCSDSTNENVENTQVPQQQEQQIEDEDVTDEYLEQAEENDLQEAKEYIEESASKYFDRYQVTIDEETNTVILFTHLDKGAVAYGINNGEWNELVEIVCNYSVTAKTYFELMGWDDVNMSVGICDFDEDVYYLGVVNGEVFYDATDELN